MRTWLIKMREKHNLSQQDVANKLDITRQYYGLIENGERQKRMDITLAQKLADIFGITIEDIGRYEENSIRS